MKVAAATPALPRVSDGAPLELAAAVKRLGTLPGVSVSRLGDVDGKPIEVVRVASTAPAGQAIKVLITGGVHGNEGVGPAAAVALAELVAKDPALRGKVELTVVPCVNPEGYAGHTRRNENDDVDLNREFIDDGTVPLEVREVQPVLDAGPYALAVDLHASQAEDSQGNAGFFAIQSGGDLAALQAAMRRFAASFPVLGETTEKYTKVENGIFTSRNQGTLKEYLYVHGTPRAYTIEAPQHLPYARQVEGMIALVSDLMGEVASGTSHAPAADGFQPAAAQPPRAAAAPVLPTAEPAKLWS